MDMFFFKRVGKVLEGNRDEFGLTVARLEVKKGTRLLCLIVPRSG